jgi:hypothetical protein
MINQTIDSEPNLPNRSAKKKRVILHIALGALVGLVLFAVFHGYLIYKYQPEPEDFQVTREIIGRYSASRTSRSSSSTIGDQYVNCRFDYYGGVGSCNNFPINPGAYPVRAKVANYTGLFATVEVAVSITREQDGYVFYQRSPSQMVQDWWRNVWWMLALEFWIWGGMIAIASLYYHQRKMKHDKS